MKLQSFIILTSYLFSFFTGTSQINNLSKAVKNSIDSTYSSLIKKNKVIGTSIAIVDNGEIVYATGYGFSDLKNEISKIVLNSTLLCIVAKFIYICLCYY